MTVALSCLFALVRACAVAILTHVMARPLCEWTNTISYGRVRSLVLFLAFGLLAIPPLNAAYTYAPMALSAIRYPLIGESLYLVLLVARSLPVYLLGYLISPPPPLTDAANHVLHLQGAAPRLGMIHAFRAGCFHRALFLMLLVGWNAFHDFEIASFLLRPTWTVSIFDAHAGGQELRYTLARMSLPILVSGFTVVCAVIALLKARRLGAPREQSARSVRRLPLVLSCCATVGMAGMYGVYPFLRILVESRDVLVSSVLQGGLWQEIVTGIGVATVAAMIAYIGALMTLSETSKRSVRCVIGSLVVASMAGSLIVSLAVFYIFQSNVFRPLLETHLPWVTGLAISLLPKSLLIAGVVVGSIPSASGHCASMLEESDDEAVRRNSAVLGWGLTGRRHVVAVVLLAYLGYLDLTSAAVLAPSRYVPAPVRLYNLMHYGHSAKLAAMLCWAFVIPLLFAILCYGVIGLSCRRPLVNVRRVKGSLSPRNGQA